MLDCDVELAEQVIDGDADIDALRAQCSEHVTRLLSLQAPVARDLRLLVTAIQVADKLERMGDLARHVAELARRRYPALVLPAELAAEFADGGGPLHRVAGQPAQGGELAAHTLELTVEDIPHPRDGRRFSPSRKEALRPFTRIEC